MTLFGRGTWTARAYLGAQAGYDCEVRDQAVNTRPRIGADCGRQVVYMRMRPQLRRWPDRAGGSQARAMASSP